MKKDKKVCWYCHNPTMELAADLGQDWLRCSNCGATEELNPLTLGAIQVVVEPASATDFKSSYRPRKRRLPKTSVSSKS